MAEFFAEYGLFALKFLTVVLLLFFALVGLAQAFGSRQKEKETIEIENITEKLDDIKTALIEEVLSEDGLKLYHKAEKAKQKKEKKEDKNKAKQEKKQKDVKNTEPEQILKDLSAEKKRLFVLRFDGDIHANAVNNLREEITAVLSVATENDEVLVCVESPGGVVHNYGLGASQLDRIKTRKIKLTVGVDLVAASGGYMMACVADQIIAAPFAVVGSIGVLAEVPNVHRLLNKCFVDIEHHTAGEYKTTLTTLAENTEEGRKKFKQEIEDTHKLFKKFVKNHRSKVDIDKLATGETWYGSQAVGNKLVDRIITTDDYLLECNEDMEIFEVTHQVKETLKEKLDSMVYQSVKASVSSVLGQLIRLRGKLGLIG